jgi:hypothetical protein
MVGSWAEANLLVKSRASFHNDGYGKAGVRGVPPGAGPRSDNSAVIRRAERSGLRETKPPETLLEPTGARAGGGFHENQAGCGRRQRRPLQGRSPSTQTDRCYFSAPLRNVSMVLRRTFCLAGGSASILFNRWAILRLGL